MRYLFATFLAFSLVSCNMWLSESPSGPTFTPPAIIWKSVSHAPLARFEGQSAVVAGKFYVFGGYTDGSIVPKSFEANVYDPATDTWERLPDMPRPITHAGTATVGKNIYLAGGVVGSDDRSQEVKLPAIDEVWRYNTQTRMWSAMPPLPEARGAGALVALDNTLHYFGGTGDDRHQETGEHWVLPLDGSTKWEIRANLPNPRNHLAGIVVNDVIYAIGGQHGHNETLVTQASVARYDPKQDRWVKLASLPYGLGHVNNSTVEVNGRIYVIGGETSGYEVYTDNVLVYDPELDAWSETTPFPRAENSLMAGAIGNRIYITGGSEGSLWTWQGTVLAE